MTRSSCNAEVRGGEGGWGASERSRAAAVSTLGLLVHPFLSSGKKNADAAEKGDRDNRYKTPPETSLKGGLSSATWRQIAIPGM